MGCTKEGEEMMNSERDILAKALGIMAIICFVGAGLGLVAIIICTIFGFFGW